MILLNAEHNTLLTTKADVVAYFIFEDKKTFNRQSALLKKDLKSIASALDSGVFTGKFQETLTLFP